MPDNALAFDQPPCTGIVTQTRWIKGEDGKDVFSAVVIYPNGPPENLTPDVVLKSRPVEIVVVAQ